MLPPHIQSGRWSLTSHESVCCVSMLLTYRKYPLFRESQVVSYASVDTLSQTCEHAWQFLDVYVKTDILTCISGVGRDIGGVSHDCCSSLSFNLF